MSDFSALWARIPLVDTPLTLALALLVGFLVGFLVYGVNVLHIRPTYLAWRFFVGAEMMQLAFALSQTIRYRTGAQALSPLLWTPIWFLFSAGLAAGMIVRRRKERGRGDGPDRRTGADRRYFGQ